MVTKKSRRSALIILAMILLTLLIGGLYATFNDVEESGNNAFTAGTLNLLAEIDGAGTSRQVKVTEGADGLYDNVTFGMLVPGDSGWIKWTLTNDGNLDGDFGMTLSTTFDDNGSNEPETAAGIGGLDGYMEVYLYRVNPDLTTRDLVGTSAIPVLASNLGTFSDSGFDIDIGNLQSGDSVQYVLQWHIDSTVGNVIQSDKANMNVIFTLDQA